jgi:peptidoglycan/LPS O-acetylase OafA/YrhL
MSGRPVSGQLETLTGLRGVAALAVLFYHVRGGMTPYLPQPLMDLFRQGYLAVDLFFVLSGFVLWWSFGDTFRKQGSAIAGSFLIKRIARIFPLHLAMLLGMLAFALAMRFAGHDLGEQYPFDQFLGHMLLVQNWGFTSELSWNDPAWSISVEWGAYLLLALLGARAARLPDGPWVFPLATLAISAAIGIWFASAGRPLIGNDIAATGLLRCIAEFAIGVLLCQWWMARGDRPLHICMVAALLGVTGAALIGFGISQPAGIPLIMAAIVILGLEASLLRRPPLAGAVAQWLGRISYSLYLSHFFLFILFKLVFVDDVKAVPPLAMLGYFVAALGLAHVLHHLVELPGRRLFQRFGDTLLLRLVRQQPA